MAEEKTTARRTPTGVGNRGKGRPKGSKNKVCISRDVGGMVLAALSECGGVEYLKQQAIENPRAFLPLVAKLMPNKIEGDADNPVRVIHTITRRIIGGRHGDGDGDA